VIGLEILHIVLQLGDAAFQRVGALNHVVMLVDLLLKLGESVLRELTGSDHTQQATKYAAEAADDRYNDHFIQRIILLSQCCRDKL